MIERSGEFQPWRMLGSLSVTVSLLLIVGCAGSAQRSVLSNSPAGAASSPALGTACPNHIPRPPDWDNPIGGVAASSYQAAEAEVSFQPREPKSLGTPVRILVTPADESGVSKDRAIAFVYDAPDFGRVVVSEVEDSITVEAYDSASRNLVSENSHPCTRGRFDVVTIKGNVQGRLVTAAAGGLTLSWREGSLVLHLTGATLTKEQIVELGNQV
jgi:hypothetical protein